MSLSEPSDETLQALEEHWSSHTCMPFPAGSLVPREETDPRSHGVVTNAQELQGQSLRDVKFAAKLLKLDLCNQLSYEVPASWIAPIAVKPTGIDEPAAPGRGSGLTGLVSHASIAWASRHHLLVDPVARRGTHPNEAGHHPAFTVPRGMAHYGEQAKCKVVNSYWETLRPVLKDSMELRLRQRDGAPVAKDAPDQVAYARTTLLPTAYGCRCEPDYEPLALGRPPKPAPKEQLDAVRTCLLIPGAEWWLLGRVFMAGLHAHLGWLPMTGYKATAAATPFIHRAAAQLLTARAEANRPGLHAATALGLAFGLFSQPPGKPPKLPSELVDTVPDRPEHLLNRTRTWISEHALGTSFFDTQLPAVLALARDVAADLTQPSLAPRIALAGHELANLGAAMAEQQLALRKWALPSESDRLARRRRRPPVPLLNADFARDMLLAHQRTVGPYFRWMGRSGFQAVKSALDGEGS